MIRAICLWHATGGAEQCDDLIQEVLLQLWTARDKLREGCSAEEEKAWVRWHCRSVISHYHRRRRLPTVPLDSAEEVAATQADEDRETIEALSTGLDERQRKVLQMILDGYRADEIAATLGVKKRSVVQMRWRIVQRMKEKTDKI